jgi:hypothetical protein
VVESENPIRLGGTVHGKFFTDQDAELARIQAALREPSHKLLLYGPRPIGKTSTLATQRSVTLGLVFDEFQEIGRPSRQCTFGR